MLQGRGTDDGRHQRAEPRHRDRVRVLGVQEERLVIPPPPSQPPPELTAAILNADLWTLERYVNIGCDIFLLYSLFSIDI